MKKVLLVLTIAMASGGEWALVAQANQEMGNRHIIQLQALSQTDPNYVYAKLPSGKIDYVRTPAPKGSHAYVNLCGWYASFFVKCLLKEDNNALSDRKTFNSFLNTFIEKVNANISDEDIKSIINALRAKNELSKEVKFEILECFGDEAVPTSGEVFSLHNGYFASILAVKTSITKKVDSNKSGHWIAAVFKVEDDNSITMYVADSLGVDRQEDVVVKAAYDWFIKEYDKIKPQEKRGLGVLSKAFRDLSVVLGNFGDALKTLIQGDSTKNNNDNVQQNITAMKKINQSEKVMDFGSFEPAEQWTLTNNGKLMLVRAGPKKVKELGNVDMSFFSHLPAFSVYNEGARSRLLIAELDNIDLNNPNVPGALKAIIPNNVNIYFYILVSGNMNYAYPDANIINFHSLLASACKDDDATQKLFAGQGISIDLAMGIFDAKGAAAGRVGNDILKRVNVHIHNDRYSPPGDDITNIGSLASFWSVAMLPSYVNLSKLKNLPHVSLDTTRQKSDVLVTYNLIVNNERDEHELKQIFQQASTWTTLCDALEEYATTKQKSLERTILENFTKTLRSLGR